MDFYSVIVMMSLYILMWQLWDYEVAADENVTAVKRVVCVFLFFLNVQV